VVDKCPVARIRVMKYSSKALGKRMVTTNVGIQREGEAGNLMPVIPGKLKKIATKHGCFSGACQGVENVV